MQSKKGILTVISGFSGAGKGTIVKKLLEKYNYMLSTSVTTRKPRINEKNGEDYFFINKEEFEKMIEKNELLEWAQYCENYYGTPKQFVKDQIEKGKDIILEIEVQGALKVKEQFEEAVLLFVIPPTVTELKQRLVGRGTEDEDTVQSRLRRSSEEVELMCQYDYIIVNDSLDKCVSEINNVIIAEKVRAVDKISVIKDLKKQFDEMK